jgi:tetratricopeptide (TPR) repeat protein
MGSGQKEVLDEVAAEIENIRTGWDWAQKHNAFENIKDSLDSLFRFYETRAWFREGERTFSSLIQSLNELKIKDKDDSTLLGTALARQGVFYERIGNYGQAREVLQASIDILERENAPGELAFSLNELGYVLFRNGANAEAKKLFQRSLEIHNELDDPPGKARTLNYLGLAYEALGEYEEAKLNYEHSLALSKELGNRRGISRVLINLSDVERLMGNNLVAKELAEDSLSISRELGALHAIAFSCGTLGEAHYSLGNYSEAKQLYEEALSTLEELGALKGIVFAWKDLGYACTALEEFQEAATWFAKALSTAWDIEALPLVLDTLAGIADLWLKTEDGKKDHARELLGLVIHHQACKVETLEKAHAILSNDHGEPLPDEIKAAPHVGKDRNLEQVIAEILEELS